MAERHSYQFQTTQWTVIVQSLQSSTSSKHALEALCQQYYRPVEFFIERWLIEKRNMVSQRAGLESKDLTQAYFAKLLSGSKFSNADPLKGKFRNYLLASVKHFLLDHESHQRSLKRGAGRNPMSLSASDQALGSELGESRADAFENTLSDPLAFPPQAYFDREWAIAIVEKAIEQVKREFLGQSESPLDQERFLLLQNAIISPQLEDISTKRWESLQWNANAFRVALHRVRKRFRFFVQQCVASTLSDPSEIDIEIDYLIRALTSCTEVS